MKCILICLIVEVEEWNFIKSIPKALRVIVEINGVFLHFLSAGVWAHYQQGKNIPKCRPSEELSEKLLSKIMILAYFRRKGECGNWRVDTVESTVYLKPYQILPLLKRIKFWRSPAFKHRVFYMPLRWLYQWWQFWNWLCLFSSGKIWRKKSDSNWYAREEQWRRQTTNYLP